jgi:hypothetical protein
MCDSHSNNEQAFRIAVSGLNDDMFKMFADELKPGCRGVLLSEMPQSAIQILREEIKQREK